MQKNIWHHAKHSIKEGGIVVALTDTIFGVLGSALSKFAVERIYRLKGRDENKPFIILISDMQELSLFGIQQSEQYQKYFKPKTSIILPVKGKKFEYLHRGGESLAFRIVTKKNKNLHALISAVGPLVAPSANPQGEKPARSIVQAMRYFGDTVDVYVPGFRKEGKPSTIISLVSGKPFVVRA